MKLLWYLLIGAVSFMVHVNSAYGQASEMAPIDTVRSLPVDSIIITVKVAFIVNKKGKITTAWVIETVCDSSISVDKCDKKKIRDLEKQAVRLVKSSSPWKPAKQDGKTVKAQFILPVRIVVLRKEFLGTQ
ncbi:MAG: hypothetical protein KAH25_10500 [Bacteroidales bacterium]|nr:hypothetical protein [Bacteroidales bacterium]